MGLGLGLRRKARMLRARSWSQYLEARRFVDVRLHSLRDRRALQRARAVGGVVGDQPLISITVATWNRADILAGRVIPSVLAQTYSNWELVIVGDACTDGTAERVAQFDDRRIRFENLPQRGEYPQQPFARRCVAGSIPMMRARELVRGDWIAHLDDDEVWLPHHLETLLTHAQQSHAEFVWGRTSDEIAPGVWRTEGSEIPRLYDMPHSSVMFRTYLRLFREDLRCWRVGLGADRHRFRRMAACGVRMSFVNEVITLGPLRPGTTRPDEFAEDREHG